MQLNRSYLICATPRSGSALLCEALNNTGLAGHPDEYFETLKATGLPRQPLQYFEGLDNEEVRAHLGSYSRVGEEPTRAQLWGTQDYTSYLARALEEGTTPNGVFGAKVMWGYLDDFLAQLHELPAFKLDAPTLLGQTFPELRYIYMTRRDKLRQAISLWRAIQTWTWRADAHEPHDAPSLHPNTLLFHAEAVDYLLQQLEAHDAAWRAFFKEYAIEPFTVVYEEFVPAYEETARALLRYLAVPHTEDLALAPRRMKQQSNHLTEDWVQQWQQTHGS